MMQQEKEFDNILSECLDRMLAAGETVEQCLERYPEQAAALEPLLRTSVTTRHALDIKPSPEFRSRARYQFQAALREMEEKKERRFFFGLRPQLVGVLASIVALLMAGSGTVYAASDDMPDEPLYQVKLATESVQLALTPSGWGKAELYARLADRRVDEIISMAEKGKTAQVEKTAGRLEVQLAAVADLMGGSAVADEPAMLSAPVASSPQPEATITAPPAPSTPAEEIDTLTATPRATQGGAQRGKAASEKGINRQEAGLNQAAQTGQQQEFREALSQQAAENQAALQGALDSVPEQAREALMRAIAATDNGYRRALGSLE